MGCIVWLVARSEPADPVEPEKKQNPFQEHEKTRKGVTGALCGKEVKTLTERHARSQSLTKKAYMHKLGTSKRDMSVKSVRKATSGEDNPLNQMCQIRKEFSIERGEVKNFVTGKGFDGLKWTAATVTPSSASSCTKTSARSTPSPSEP